MNNPFAANQQYDNTMANLGQIEYGIYDGNAEKDYRNLVAMKQEGYDVTGAKNLLKHSTTNQLKNDMILDEKIEALKSIMDAEKAEEQMQEEQKELWEREDAIRKETQEREDTAYQRAVDDMIKAGINPNLMNVSPAASGGGITSATKKDMTRYQTEATRTLELLKQEIQKEFQGRENEKDRISNLINKVIGFASLGILKGL